MLVSKKLYQLTIIYFVIVIKSATFDKHFVFLVRKFKFLVRKIVNILLLTLTF